LGRHKYATGPYWTALPREARPRLYLHGLSLGSYYSDLSTDFYKVINDPFDGAFWVGPPYSSRSWRQITAAREPGSPAWFPRFRDGALVRFTAQQNALDDGHAPRGGMRIVYLQYASDPVTFLILTRGGTARHGCRHRTGLTFRPA
jgi:uncharacterized membrane protein